MENDPHPYHLKLICHLIQVLEESHESLYPLAPVQMHAAQLPNHRFVLNEAKEFYKSEMEKIKNSLTACTLA